jgi:hypothetical protein
MKFAYGPFSPPESGPLFSRRCERTAGALSRTAVKEGLVMSMREARDLFIGIRPVLLCAGFLVAALPAAAQQAPALEVSAGYRLLRVQRGFGVDLSDVKETLHGVYAEASANETDLLSLVGQGAVNGANVSGQKVTAYEFAAGPRFNQRSRRRTLFGQFLVGVAHYRPHGTERSTNATLHLGGGVTIKASDRVGLRVGGDYELIFTGGSNLLFPETGSRTQGLRMTTGVVFPIGG